MRSVDIENAYSDEVTWPAVAAREPTAEEAAMVTDDVEALMRQLSEADRDILVKRLQGETVSAIATVVDCSDRTVRRSLQRIRETYLKLHGLDEVSVVAIRSLEPAKDCAEAPTKDEDRSEGPDGAVQTPAGAESNAHQFQISDIVMERFIGQGAFGRVYRSRLKSDGSNVAVKFLRRHLWQDTAASRQLISEVQTASAITHPGIVRHFGWGRTPGNAVFSVMEWIDGVDLATWLRSHIPSVSEAIECGVSLCDALHATHASEIVHGDLTPRNVLRRNDGSHVVTDFGFSRSFSAPVLMATAGTPGFLAPEQLCDAFGCVSERTDVYGVGGVLFYLLAGRPPVAEKEPADGFAATLSLTEIEPVGVFRTSVSAALEELISGCLAKEPDERPATVDEVGAQLRYLLSQIENAP